MSVAADAAVAALLLAGAVFALIGAFGLAKLSDFYRRAHAPTKATTLGVGCILLASAIHFAAVGEPGLREVLVAAFLFVTAPVGAHMLVKAALALRARAAARDIDTPAGDEERGTP